MPYPWGALSSVWTGGTRPEISGPDIVDLAHQVSKAPVGLSYGDCATMMENLNGCLVSEVAYVGLQGHCCDFVVKAAFDAADGSRKHCWWSRWSNRTSMRSSMTYLNYECVTLSVVVRAVSGNYMIACRKIEPDAGVQGSCFDGAEVWASRYQVLPV